MPDELLDQLRRYGEALERSILLGESDRAVGLQVTDLRCRTGECPDGLTAMFFPASDVDGAARIVVDPSATYEIHGQGSDTGWPRPQYTNDGSTFWFSPAYEVKGSDLRDGHVFFVDGAPAPPGG